MDKILVFVAKGQSKHNLHKEGPCYWIDTKKQHKMEKTVKDVVDSFLIKELKESAFSYGTQCAVYVILKRKPITRMKEIMKLLQANFEFDLIEWR